MILSQIIALLQLALTLLISSIGTPIQPQATDIANRAIVIAQETILKYQASLIPSSTPALITEPQPQSSTSMSQQIQIKPSMKSITIISGIDPNRKYKAAEFKVNPDGTGTPYNNDNYVNVNLVIRDDNGNATSTAIVTIEATDASQNKTLDGTGDIGKIYRDGIKETVPIYSFYYQLKSVGPHTIKFSANGVTKIVNLEVSE